MENEPEINVLQESKVGLQVECKKKPLQLQIDETGTVEVQVKNDSYESVSVRKIYPHAQLGRNSQFSLKRGWNYPYFIHAYSNVFFNFTCKARQLGITRDLFIFEFSDNRLLECYLEVEVTGEASNSTEHSRSETSRGETSRGETSRREPSYGETSRRKTFRREPSRGELDTTQCNDRSCPPKKMIKLEYPTGESEMQGKGHSSWSRAPLPEYNVPSDAKQLVKNHLLKDVQNIARYENFPSINQPICQFNYVVSMQTLVHLEEAEVTEKMKLWKLKEVQLTPSEESNIFKLQVPGMSKEKFSPKLGDLLSIRNTTQGKNFYGVVRKKTQDFIFLEFNDLFPTPTVCDYFNIKVCFNRIPFRRLHAAVDAAWRELGISILFPSGQIQIQKPQLDLEEEGTSSSAKPKVVPVTASSTRTANHEEKHCRSPAVHALMPERPVLLNQVKNPIIQIKEHEFEGFYSQLQSLAIPGQGDNNSPGSFAVPVLGQPSGCPLTESPESADRGDLQEVPTVPGESNSANTVARQHKVCWVNTQLNAAQRNAVRYVLKGEARALPYIIFGPPGTGKTMTLVETILQLFLLLPHARILIGTPSNSAADLIAQRLLQSGRMKEDKLVRLVSFSYKDQVPKYLDNYTFVACRDDVDNCKKKFDFVWPNITVGTCAALALLSEDSSANFTHVIIDEAGQVTEPEAMLVAALMGKPAQIILAGDPMQLGPVVLGRAANLGGLGVSLLERLLHNGPYVRNPRAFPASQGYNPLLVTMLVENYRSVPEILNLSAGLFYNGELIPTVSQTKGVEAEVLQVMAKKLPRRDEGGPPALVFIGVQGHCEREKNSSSFYNTLELEEVLSYVKALYEVDIGPCDLGIISPYKKQVEKMALLLQKNKMMIPKIGSVEEFQGQERLVVILSTVRSKENYKEQEGLGFLDSKHRINTAITRARALLIVIGDPHLLVKDPTWRAVIEDCIKRQAYTGCDKPVFPNNVEGNKHRRDAV